MFPKLHPGYWPDTYWPRGYWQVADEGWQTFQSFADFPTVVTIIEAVPPSAEIGEAEYEVWLKDHDGEIVARFDNWESLVLTKRLNGVGSCRIQLDGDDSRVDLFQTDYQIIVRRRNPRVNLDWYTEWEGFHRTPTYNTEKKGKNTFASHSFSYERILERRHILYNSGTSQASKSGVGETVIKEILNENLGILATIANGRYFEGAFTGFSIEADQGRGTSWQGDRAHKNVLKIVEEICRETNLIFEVIGNGAAEFLFNIYENQRADRTNTDIDPFTGLNSAGNTPVRFAKRFGNMAIPIFSEKHSDEITAVAVLGPGVESERLITTRTNDDAIAVSPWNHIEGTIQASQQEEDTDREVIGDEYLKKNEAVQTFNFDLIQSPQQYYGKHFFLGDLISGEWDGTQYTLFLNETSIRVDDGGEDLDVQFTTQF